MKWEAYISALKNAIQLSTLCSALQFGTFFACIIGCFSMYFSLTMAKWENYCSKLFIWQVLQCWNNTSPAWKAFSLWTQYKCCLFFCLSSFGSGYPVFKKTKWKIQTWTPCSNCSLSTYEDAQTNFGTLIFCILCNFWSDWQTNIYCKYKIFIFVDTGVFF